MWPRPACVGDCFDGSASDPFALQDRVVDGVLCGVASRLTEAEIARACGKDPRDIASRDLAPRALPLAWGTNVPSAAWAVHGRTVSEILEVWPWADTGWLEAITRAGMPLGSRRMERNEAEHAVEIRVKG